jgi:hypothetical protein
MIKTSATNCAVIRLSRAQPTMAREKVEHDRQVQPAFFGRDIGDVRNPPLIDLADVEILR